LWATKQGKNLIIFTGADRAEERPTDPHRLVHPTQTAINPHLPVRYIAQQAMFGASMIITRAKMPERQTLPVQSHLLLKFMMTAHQMKHAVMEPVY